MVPRAVEGERRIHDRLRKLPCAVSRSLRVVRMFRLFRLQCSGTVVLQ